MSEIQRTNEEYKISDSPLGKPSSYINEYTPSLLYSIPRKRKRDEINVLDVLPFHGFDTWNAYELSWLNQNGKPQVAIAQFDISCTSINIVESKSFKLYLNSFNNTKFDSIAAVKDLLIQDISNATEGRVNVEIFSLEKFSYQPIMNFEGECIDERDIICDNYYVAANALMSDSKKIVEEKLFSHLLKSNCLVTGQPDWGSVSIIYKGAQIDKDGLLKYLVSFRNHNEFHEQCVERIFMDILGFCKPEKLTVEARYTRRGGLDINPVRSTEEIQPTKNIRMARQ
jgi:7-cyano-7-deazaguanine reductase